MSEGSENNSITQQLTLMIMSLRHTQIVSCKFITQKVRQHNFQIFKVDERLSSHRLELCKAGKWGNKFSCQGKFFLRLHNFQNRKNVFINNSLQPRHETWSQNTKMKKICMKKFFFRRFWTWDYQMSSILINGHRSHY